MDMQPGVEGGSWLAMNMRTGDISVLLNIREPKPLAKAEIGRGFLAVDYLKLENRSEKVNYLQELKTNSDKYNGFSLITIDRDDSKIYSLSSFSNRSNCLKLNQSKKSYVITNSMRTDNPFYRGIVFKKKFDTLLRANGLINDSKQPNDLNTSDSSFDDLNNDQTNEQTNVWINDSSDNLKDCSIKPNAKKPAIETQFSIENCNNQTSCDKKCSNKNCAKTAEQIKRTNNRHDEKLANRSDLLDFRKSENQEILIENLLNVMLSSQNYYEQEKRGDYFQIQFCLATESVKQAVSSLCISLPEHNYGSRTFTIILVDSDDQVNYYERTREHVADKCINRDLNRNFQFNLP